MIDKKISYCENIKYAGICIIFFFLPFLKVAKNVGIGLIIIGAVVSWVLNRPFQFRKPDIFEWLLLFISSICLASTVVNWPLENSISGLRDTLNFTIIAFFVYNFVFSEKQLRFLLWTVVAGAVIGLILGFIDWKISGLPLFEFRNMMVAETSVITSIMTAVLIGVLYDSRSAFKKFELVITIILLPFFFSCLALMGNRSGLLGLIFFFALYFLMFLKHKKTIIMLGVITVSILILVVLYTFGESKMNDRINHLFANFTQNQFSNSEQIIRNGRFDYWRIAWAQALSGEKRYLGVGPRNFKSIDIDKFDFDPPLIVKRIRPCHAHNHYLTKLCEEGIIGLFALLTFFGYTVWILLKAIKTKYTEHWTWAACLGALVISNGGGIFYAPFRREVAWVTIFFIALAANQFKISDFKERV